MVEFSNIKNKMSISLLKGDKDIYLKYFNTIKNSPILMEMYLLSQDLNKLDKEKNDIYKVLVSKKIEEKLKVYSKKDILSECEKLKVYDINVDLSDELKTYNNYIDKVLFENQNIEVISESVEFLSKRENKKIIKEDVSYDLYFKAQKNVISKLVENMNDTEIMIINSVLSDSDDKLVTFNKLKENVIKNINNNKETLSESVYNKSINKINSLQYNESSYIDDIYTLYKCL